jgi:hypothetical protein
MHGCMDAWMDRAVLKHLRWFAAGDIFASTSGERVSNLIFI